MKILCLDQATKITGWSIWDNQKLVAQGKFSFEEDDNLASRLHQIKINTEALVEYYHIQKTHD